jgi:prepilin-type N-terminal cleavage/methylation domain-containing protein
MKPLLLHVRERGFTIVELLVTIVIISVLASIGIVAYNAVQTRTNDDVRAADVETIMDALEQYYRKNGDYPANDTMNPSQFYPTMTNFTAIKSLLPSLNDDALTGPGGYSFYPACLNSAWCPNGSADWPYSMKKYLYLSRFVTGGSPGAYWWYKVPSTYAGNTGWGCDVQTYYTNPGYVIAWYSESKKIWIFKRSQHGQVDMANNTTAGPIAPQTCTFS